MKKKTTKTPKLKDNFKVLLKVNGQEYKSEGETMFEALSNIPISYLDACTQGEFVLSKGKVSVEYLLYLRQLRALLSGDMRRAGWADQFTELLKIKSS